MLDKFRSGMSYSAFGREFDVNEPIIYTFRKGKRKFSKLHVKSTLQHAKVKSIVHDKAIQNIENLLHLWIQEMTTMKKV